MKTLSSMTKKFVTLLLVLVLSFSAFACDRQKDSSPDSSSIPPAPAVKITVTSDKDSIRVGEEVNLTVVVTNSDNPDYDWTVSANGKDIVQIADNVLTIKEGAIIKFDTSVTVTATAAADATAKASKTILVIAPVVEGRVGDLTSEMVEAIGDPSITVTGTLTDVYFNNYNSYLSYETVYDMTVEMEEGKWKGAWKVEGDTDYISDSYRKGAKDGVRDQNGNIGHEMERMYINKNNEVAVERVKDYMSFSAVWESQHLWNHLANLDVNKFAYDAENDYYVYTVDQNDMDALYLMTYLSYSLTPLLADTLSEIAFTVDVEAGAITSLIGKTERTYIGLDEQSGDFEAYMDTIIELTFSNVGSTSVSDPTPYGAPQNADKLEEALNEMKNAKNYTFDTVDVTISAAQGSDDDYYMEGVNINNTSTGTVGTLGKVTEDKILIRETGKYSYTMDGEGAYHYSYRGYVQNDDGTYDYFENRDYTTTTNKLIGQRKYVGNMFDAMPTFDFSANVFKYAGTETMPVGNSYVSLHKYVLRESSITREVGMELCVDGKDGAPLAIAKLTVWVIDAADGCHLYKSSVPYDLVSGTYTGTYDTTYGNVGETVIDEANFVDYVPRVIPQSWDEMETKDSNENAQTVIDNYYGSAGKDVPTPVMFFEIFGDAMNGPFTNTRASATQKDSEGNPIEIPYMSFNFPAMDHLIDENTRIIDFDAYLENIKTKMASYGYAISQANTDLTGGEKGTASKWITFMKGDILVVMENNNTRFFFVTIYKVGDWNLNR